MIDMNDWLKAWDAYYTPAQTLSDGVFDRACLVVGGSMALVFAVLFVVSFLRHGIKGNRLAAIFVIGALSALIFCIPNGFFRPSGTDANNGEKVAAAVDTKRKRPDMFGERLEKVTGVEYLSCSTGPLGIENLGTLAGLPSKDRYTCRFVTKDGRLVENGRLVVDHDHGRVGLFDGDGKAVIKGKESK